MQIECDHCGETEMITLDDLPITPGGKFLIIDNARCTKCLRYGSFTVNEEDTIFEVEKD
jgi:hypothetical protein